MTAIPQVWFYVTLMTVDLATGTDLVTFDFVPIGRVSSSGSGLAILKDIGNVGSTMGEFLPRGISGDIILDNSPNSLGYERRMSDIFDRYTPVDQLVQIYGVEQTDGGGPTYTLLHSCRCATWTLENNSYTLRIVTDSRTIAKRTVTKVIDSVNFPNAPSKNLGKHLPVVFGADVEVKPLLIAAAGDLSPEFAYATTLSDDFPVGGVQTYYALDAGNEYGAVLSAASTSTRYFGTTTTNTSLGLPDGQSFAQSLNGYVQGTTSYVITGGIIRFLGWNNGAAVTDGVITLKILAAGFPNGIASDLPGTAIAQSIIQVSDHAADFKGVAEFNVEFTFDRPTPITNAEPYWLGIFWSGNNGPYALNVRQDIFTVQAGCYIKAGATSWVGPANWALLTYGLYGAVFTDSPDNANENDAGLGHAYFEVTQKAAATGQIDCDLTDLNMIVAIDGYKDNSTGGITGSANSLIENPKHALTLLDYEWTGSAWSAATSRIDTTKYSATHTQLTASSYRYYRKIAGATTGRTFLETAIRNICANSLLRVALINGATQYLGVYAHGVNIASSAYISDEESRILRVEQGRTDTIVNRMTMYYDKRLRDLDTTSGSAEGEFTNYAKTLDWYSSYSSLTTALSAISKLLYGERLIDDPTYEWLSDTTSAENVAAFLLGHYATPHIFVQLAVPLFKFNTLDIFDVVTLVHPDLPSYFGTSSNAKPPSYLGQEVVNINETPLRRAKHWRAQIEARQIDFSIKNYPELILTTRLLNNYPGDPT